MKIVLTGCNGFIGKNAYIAFSKNHDVIAIDKDDPLPSLSGVDWVIHMGGISSTVEQDVAKILKYNLYYSIDLLEECIQHGVNLQWSSSASVYGKSITFNELDNPNPNSHYSRSKWMFEQYCTSRNASITIQGFRYFNVYGKYESHKKLQASPFEQFRHQAISTGKIKIFKGSDKIFRDFVPVEYVIETHLKMLNISESGIWNIGTGAPITFLDVAEKIAKEYNAIIEEIEFPEHLKAHYQYYTCADTTKLNTTLATI